MLKGSNIALTANVFRGCRETVSEPCSILSHIYNRRAAVVLHNAWTLRSLAVYDKGGFIKPPLFQPLQHHFHSNLQHRHPFPQQMPFVVFLAQLDLWLSPSIWEALVWIHLLMIFFNCERRPSLHCGDLRWPAQVHTGEFCEIWGVT